MPIHDHNHTYDGTPNAPREAASDVLARRLLDASLDCSSCVLDSPNDAATSDKTFASVKSRFSHQ